MKELRIEVNGMRCGMCETHVNDIIRKTVPVKKVTSSHGKNLTIVILEDDVDQDIIIKAITSQGYEVGKIESYPYVKKGLFSIFKK